jgi:hypothetical protein
MEIPFWLSLGFLDSLLLVWSIEAYRRGHRLYGLAAIGLVLAIIGQMSRDIASTTQVLLLQVFGLGLAGLVLAFHLLTEEVELPTSGEDGVGRAPEETVGTR